MNHIDFVRHLPAHHKNYKKTPLYRWKIDLYLLVALLALVSFGLFILYSASGQSLPTLKSQILHLGIAFFGLFIIAHIPPRWMMFLSPIGYLACLFFLILVYKFGFSVNGSQRWISLPGIGQFQPSELMKLLMPFTVASFFAQNKLPPSVKTIALSLVIIGIPTLLILKQPDLGTAILTAVSGLFVLFFAGLQWRIIFPILALLPPLAYALFKYVIEDYQRQRIITLFDPESDPLGKGWNIIQAKTAIGSGGINGKGWLQGTQAQLDFLPESSTDFIYAVIAEELGLIGVLILFALYLLVLARCLVITLNAETTFTRLLAASLSLTFFIYIVVNVGMVSGLLPVVGVPLPLISYGGTSLVTLLAGFGTLMSIQTHKRRL